MNRAGLRHLARTRLAEAKVLLDAGCFDGAYYLCGYAVECGLKACIAKKTMRSDFPDLDQVRKSYTHNVAALLNASGLEAAQREGAEADPALAANWTVVKDWTEAARYAPHSPDKARNLYRAVTHRSHGVMRWIRRHW